MHTQKITIQEVEEFASRLVQKEILNAKGKDALLTSIKNKAIKVEHQSPIDGISFTEDSLTKQTILQFCSDVFYMEMLYRVFKNRAIEQKIEREDSLIARWTAYPRFRQKKKFH